MRLFFAIVTAVTGFLVLSNETWPESLYFGAVCVFISWSLIGWEIYENYYRRS